jgi:pimeloyl-ACP methyl ester carboxylesterase
VPYVSSERSGRVRLYYEETGSGAPLVFVHEFSGDHRSWEPQVRFFSRRYRCITYSARGYTPSDVPSDPKLYSQQAAVDDLIAVLDGLGIAAAHVVGLSMGGFATLHLGLRHPERARSLVAAGVGYGAKPGGDPEMQAGVESLAAFYAEDSRGAAAAHAATPGRIPFEVKDPRGYSEFAAQLARHPGTGSANTMRGVQGRRPNLYDLGDELAALEVPLLLIVGDEDEPCLEPGIFLKRTVRTSGLAVLPRTGHTVNLEEPAAFNALVLDFITAVEGGAWQPRDPRSLVAEQLGRG